MKVPQSPVSCDVLNDVQSFSKKILTWSHVQFIIRRIEERWRSVVTVVLRSSFYSQIVYRHTRIRNLLLPEYGNRERTQTKANEEAWI